MRLHWKLEDSGGRGPRSEPFARPAIRLPPVFGWLARPTAGGGGAEYPVARAGWMTAGGCNSAGMITVPELG